MDINADSDEQYGPIERFLWRLFPVPFLAIGVFALFITVAEVRMGQATADWAETQGTVLSARLDVGYSSRNASQVKGYRPSVEYEYTVDDIRYTGNRFEHALSATYTTDKALVEEQLKAFSEGSAVNVFYDPADPTRSVLVPGVASGLALKLGVGLGFTLAGAVGAYYMTIKGRLPPKTRRV